MQRKSGHVARRVGRLLVHVTQTDPILVMSATFQLEPGDPKRMRRIMDENLRVVIPPPPAARHRAARSIFKKIEGVGAERLIDVCGLKGISIGQGKSHPLPCQHLRESRRRYGCRSLCAHHARAADC
ncbi:MAG: hypothetical protein U5K38_07590 [Woeseiaceae bacterium]|nr:hypothetical protein [Woeseiaceae bacterium]